MTRTRITLVSLFVASMAASDAIAQRVGGLGNGPRWATTPEGRMRQIAVVGVMLLVVWAGYLLDRRSKRPKRRKSLLEDPELAAPWSQPPVAADPRASIDDPGAPGLH